MLPNWHGQLSVPLRTLHFFASLRLKKREFNRKDAEKCKVRKVQFHAVYSISPPSRRTLTLAILEWLLAIEPVLRYNSDMRRIQYWALLAIALLVGCSPTVIVKPDGFDHHHISGHRNFVVDGITYGTTDVHGQKDEKWYSIILIFPDTQHYFAGIGWLNEEPHGQIYFQEENEWKEKGRRIVGMWAGKEQSPDFHGTKIADAVFNHVYFIADGKVVAQKSNEELGFNFSEPKYVGSSLQPIYEKLIRENVPPQEPETEEEP